MSARLFVSACCVVMLFVALAGPASPAAAGTVITVTTFVDELNAGGACSLREAVRSANTNSAIGGCPAGAAGEDTIVLGAGTYTLSIGPSGDDLALNGDLDFTGDTVLLGAGSTSTTVTAAAGWTDRIAEVHVGTDVTMRGVKITGGNILTSNGGGIFNWGTLTLVNSEVSQNQSASAGGGIASQGPLVIIGSTVAGNTGDDGGGGINHSGGELTIIASTITSNNTSGQAGGIYSNGPTLIQHSSIIGNQAGSHGGGITVNDLMSIRNSTIYLNAAVGNGGGVYGFGGLTIENSTISGNNAFENGGGLYKTGSSTWALHNVTITANRADSDTGGNPGNGGGVYNSSGTMSMRNSILALNQDMGGATINHDCTGTLNSLGYNLIYSGTGCNIVGTTTGNLLGLDPRLGPLQNNGGPTTTHALLTSPNVSPAINAGDPIGCYGEYNNLLPADQRYAARAGRCDMGAYELNACLLPGDVDDDRDVDVDDITLTAQVWDVPTANYNAAADVDWDGFNTLLDIQKGASQFGQTCP